jgi:hypothetical protein
MNIQNEIWKVVPQNRKYVISNMGRIASARGGSSRVLSPFDNGKGYKQIRITTDAERNYYIHRLVAQAFIPNPENKKEVNHIDANKSNNAVTNLEWVNLQENREHAKSTGLIWRGEKAPGAKLKEADVLDIRRIFQENPKENKSEIGRRFGVGCEAIIKIVRRQRWQHI